MSSLSHHFAYPGISWGMRGGSLNWTVSAATGKSLLLMIGGAIPFPPAAFNRRDAFAEEVLQAVLQVRRLHTPVQELAVHKRSRPLSHLASLQTLRCLRRSTTSAA